MVCIVLHSSDEKTFANCHRISKKKLCQFWSSVEIPLFFVDVKCRRIFPQILCIFPFSVMQSDAIVFFYSCESLNIVKQKGCGILFFKL